MMKKKRNGFSLIEVLVALLIIVIFYASLSSIMARNYYRVAGGESVDQILDLAHMKLMESIETGYPPELIAPTNWESFHSSTDEDMELYPSFRWRMSVEDLEDPEWAEGSDRDEDLRTEVGIVDPYRSVIIEVQEFEIVDNYLDETLTLGKPFVLSRIMKPEMPPGP